MEYLIAGIAYFVFVFFKAFQQRNVAFLHYKLIMPTSYLLAGTEVFVYALITFSVIKAGGLTPELLWYVFAVGTGGGLGAMLGMKLHDLITPMSGGQKVKIGGAKKRNRKHYEGVNVDGRGCVCMKCIDARMKMEDELGD